MLWNSTTSLVQWRICWCLRFTFRLSSQYTLYSFCFVLVFLTYLLFTKYRYRVENRRYFAKSNRYRIEIEILISSHHYTALSSRTQGRNAKQRNNYTELYKNNRTTLDMKLYQYIIYHNYKKVIIWLKKLHKAAQCTNDVWWT